MENDSAPNYFLKKMQLLSIGPVTVVEKMSTITINAVLIPRPEDKAQRSFFQGPLKDELISLSEVPTHVR